MVHIYILELTNGKYYVGKTNNPGFSIDSDFNLNDSAWTRKYRPIRLCDLIHDCENYDDDKYTRIYMDEHGIENVRGGSFCEEILDEAIVKMLVKTCVWNQKCITCGQMEEFRHGCEECKNCEKLDDINKCLTTIEKFIKEKRELEKVQEKYKRPYFPPPGVEWMPTEDWKIWNANGGELSLEKETKRANEQKQKNDEYLPILNAIHKSIKILNDKMNEKSNLIRHKSN